MFQNILSVNSTRSDFAFFKPENFIGKAIAIVNDGEIVVSSQNVITLYTRSGESIDAKFGKHPGNRRAALEHLFNLAKKEKIS